MHHFMGGGGASLCHFWCKVYASIGLESHIKQAGLLHSGRCDLCWNDGTLLYSGILSLYGENSVTTWQYAHGNFMSLNIYKQVQNGTVTM